MKNIVIIENFYSDDIESEFLIDGFFRISRKSYNEIDPIIRNKINNRLFSNSDIEIFENNYFWIEFIDSEFDLSHSEILNLWNLSLRIVKPNNFKFLYYLFCSSDQIKYNKFLDYFFSFEEDLFESWNLVELNKAKSIFLNLYNSYTNKGTISSFSRVRQKNMHLLRFHY